MEGGLRVFKGEWLRKRGGEEWVGDYESVRVLLMGRGILRLCL